MSIFEAILLGVIQGLTEFLPVSSSGHLVIFQHLLGFTTPPIFFDVMIHFATLIAVLYFFRERLFNLDKQTLLRVAVASVPAGLLGMLMQPYLEIFFSSLWLVVAGLYITALLLYQLKQVSTQSIPLSKITFKTALIPGLFQAIAVFPGISRSGSTIFGGIKAGLKRPDAFYFSFLLAIPTILGASLIEVSHLDSLDQIEWVPVIVGMITAFGVGLLALKLLQKIIMETKLYYFSYYCAGIATLLLASLLIEQLLG